MNGGIRSETPLNPMMEKETDTLFEEEWGKVVYFDTTAPGWRNW